MRKILLVTAATFTLSAGGLWAQAQPSPDTQQQAHPDASPQSHQPETKTGQDSATQSPDQQQDKAAGETGSSNKKSHRHKNNARQAKGTPKPTSTSTDK